MIKQNTLTAILLTAAASLAFSQEALKSQEEEYYDFLSLDGIVERPFLNYRTLSDSVWTIPEDAEGNIWAENNLGSQKQITDHISYKLFGPDWYNSFNTAAPYGQNDGALWQGKGYNTSLTAGAMFQAYGFSVTVKPQICFQQNMEFDIMTSAYENKYGYFTNAGGSIDFPQRFGETSFWTFSWGDTEARYTWKMLTAGFGTESIWLGPAWLNPMLGSNNAEGYPHFDIGIKRTPVYFPWIQWYMGDFEMRVWTGMLTESDYFNSDSSDDHTMINALSVSFAPSVIPGLTIGMNRIFLNKWEWYNLKYLGRLFTTSESNDVNGEGDDQKVTFSAEWKFPKAGFDIYGEIGIDDYAYDKIANPFHTMIYTLGVRQTIPVVPSKNIKGELVFEYNNFEMSQDFQLQWQYTGFYSHGKILHGYTNRGQILGAGSGAFGNSQYLGFRVYYPKGNSMLYFHRYCPDNNYIYNKAVNATAAETNTYWGVYNTYFCIGVNSAFYCNKNFLITADINYSFINAVLYGDDPDCLNFYFAAGLKYIF